MRFVKPPVELASASTQCIRTVDGPRHFGLLRREILTTRTGFLNRVSGMARLGIPAG
jgi:hypothetical protein